MDMYACTFGQTNRRTDLGFFLLCLAIMTDYVYNIRVKCDRLCNTNCGSTISELRIELQTSVVCPT